MRGTRPSTEPALVLGVAGAVVTFMSLALLNTIVHPPFLSADEIHHLDYAWRVGHGELPQFTDGITLPAEGPRHSTQWVFQHPPLFYALLAPIATPLLDAEHWRIATLASRVLVGVVGAVGVVAIAWSSARVTAKRDPALAVGAASVAATTTAYVGTSSAVYNDSLVVLLATVCLGLAALAIRHPRPTRHIALFVLTCAAGMATRASFIAILLVAGPFVVVAFALASPSEHATRRVGRATGAAAALVVLPLIASGWFYLRNIGLTGHWTGMQAEYARDVLGRTARAPFDVVTDSVMWRRGFGGLLAQPVDVADTSILWRVVPTVLLATVFALAVARAGRWVVRARWSAVWKPGVAIVMMLTLVAAAFVGMFFLYISRGGGLNPRYLLPALLPFSLAAAAGLSLVDRARGLGVVVFMVAAAFLSVEQSARLLRHRTFEPNDSAWSVWSQGAELNGIPGFAVAAMLAGAATGICMVATSLWRLTDTSLRSTE